jgi:acetyltransferase EpsM
MVNVILIGAGNLAKEIEELILDTNKLSSGFKVIGNLVENETKELTLINSRLKIKEIPRMKELRYIFAVGSPVDRARIYNLLDLEDTQLVTLIHPDSHVSISANIGLGSIVFPNSYVGTNSTIGKFSIVYYGVNIAHDCKIGNFVNLAPGVCLAGNVTVGNLTSIGTNATLLPKITVQNNNVVGAGAVVTKNFPSYTTSMGNPAKIFNS